MRKGLLRTINGLAVSALFGCASSGVMTIGNDTYMVSKRSAQMGFGPPVGATAYVYKEANGYCANTGKKVETLKLDQVDSAFGRPAAASLQFRCVVASAQVKPLTDQCKSELDTSELDPIRAKVELFRDSWESPVPFAIATIDAFPTEAERTAISKWATLREDCIKRGNAAFSIPPTSTPLQATEIQQDRSFGQAGSAKVGDLIVAIYQEKLTYGEFAKKRYEITREAAEAERQYRQSMQMADQQQRMQAQQFAQQQFANNLAAWSTYMQAVNARQPQSVHIDGTIRVQ